MQLRFTYIYSLHQWVSITNQLTSQNFPKNKTINKTKLLVGGVELALSWGDGISHYATYSNNYFSLADALELLTKRCGACYRKTIKNPYHVQSIKKHKLQLL